MFLLDTERQQLALIAVGESCVLVLSFMPTLLLRTRARVPNSRETQPQGASGGQGT